MRLDADEYKKKECHHDSERRRLHSTEQDLPGERVPDRPPPGGRSDGESKHRERHSQGVTRPPEVAEGAEVEGADETPGPGGQAAEQLCSNGHGVHVSLRVTLNPNVRGPLRRGQPAAAARCVSAQSGRFAGRRFATRWSSSDSACLPMCLSCCSSCRSSSGERPANTLSIVATCARQTGAM